MAARGLTISVGELRQNPAGMIHAVRLGSEYVLTDRGVPTARIVPYVAQRWVNADDARDLLSVRSDYAWLAQLRQARRSESPSDPWAAR